MRHRPQSLRPYRAALVRPDTGTSPQARLLAAAVAAALAGPAVSQQRLFDVLERPSVPQAGTNPTAAVRGDVDGDGDLDLVVGGNGQQPRLYRNGGGGGFEDVTAAQMPVGSLSISDLALGDVDGDGDLDLVLGDTSSVRLYLNDGAGTFASAANLPGAIAATGAVALGDIDGDGDLDLMLGRRQLQSQLLVNDGTGVFRDATAAQMPALTQWVSALELGDVDGDGDLDAVVGTPAGYFVPQWQLLRNNGGVFSNAGVGIVPVSPEFTTALTLVDADVDGDLDMVVGSAGSYYFPGGLNRLYLNDGTGTFALSNGLPSSPDDVADLEVGDIDGDGDDDLIVGNTHATYGGGHNRVYRNVGAGNFVYDVLALPNGVDETAAVTLGDYDLDGDLDLVVVNRGSAGRSVVLLNDGHGVFAELLPPGPAPTTAPFSFVTHGDFDGDRNPDLLLCSSSLQQFRGDGRGLLVPATFTLPQVLGVKVVASGDVDLDGDVDVVAGFDGQRCKLLLNGGAGVFTDGSLGRLNTPSLRATAAALVDVDGDADLDLLVATYMDQSRLYRNLGGGSYGEVTGLRLPIAILTATSMAVADFDGDGDVDVVLGTTDRLDRPGAQNQLWLNDGAGLFTDATAGRLPAVLDHTQALQAGDVDGDGDLDLVVGNASAFTSPESVGLLLNDGTGTFTASAGLPTVFGAVLSLALADGDGDGDLDLLVGRGPDPAGGAEHDQYFENAGNGTFADATAKTALAGTSTASVAMVDLDRDGDPEMVVARSAAVQGTTLAAYTNLSRQLDAPRPLQLGGTFHLDAYARFGPPRTTDLVLPYVAIGAADIPLPPLGVVGIDPASALPLPSFTVPQPAGVATLALGVPVMPWAVGLRLHFQALHLQVPVSVRLGNVVSGVIGL